MMDIEELKRDLQKCQSMLGSMCAEGRPPKMSIPARPDHDEDIIISTTINRAIAKLEAAQRLRDAVAKFRSLPVAQYDILYDALAAFDKEQQ